MLFVLSLTWVILATFKVYCVEPLPPPFPRIVVHRGIDVPFVGKALSDFCPKKDGPIRTHGRPAMVSLYKPNDRTFVGRLVLGAVNEA